MPENLSQVVGAGDTSKPATILIIEDEALLAAYIKTVLAESGFRVAGIAACGPEAVSLADEHRPHLALVDIRLPGPDDGIALACRLRREFGVPPIFLSGALDGPTIARAQAAQPLGFLRKPFRPSQVFNAIERALGGRDR